MFKNPINKYQAGGSAPSKEQQEMLAAFVQWLPKRVKEFANMQPEQIVEALNGMSKTPEGQKQVQAYMEQFQKEMQGEAGMFKEGGKLNAFVCKHAKGGHMVDCGCHQEGGRVRKVGTYQEGPEVWTPRGYDHISINLGNRATFGDDEYFVPSEIGANLLNALVPDGNIHAGAAYDNGQVVMNPSTVAAHRAVRDMNQVEVPANSVPTLARQKGGFLPNDVNNIMVQDTTRRNPDGSISRVKIIANPNGDAARQMITGRDTTSVGGYWIDGQFVPEGDITFDNNELDNGIKALEQGPYYLGGARKVSLDNGKNYLNQNRNVNSYRELENGGVVKGEDGLSSKRSFFPAPFKPSTYGPYNADGSLKIYDDLKSLRSGESIFSKIRNLFRRYLPSQQNDSQVDTTFRVLKPIPGTGLLIGTQRYSPAAEGFELKNGGEVPYRQEGGVVKGQSGLNIPAEAPSTGTIDYPQVTNPVRDWIDRTVDNNPTLRRLSRGFRNFGNSAVGKTLGFMLPDPENALATAPGFKFKMPYIPKYIREMYPNNIEQQIISANNHSVAKPVKMTDDFANEYNRLTGHNGPLWDVLIEKEGGKVKGQSGIPEGVPEISPKDLLKTYKNSEYSIAAKTYPDGTIEKIETVYPYRRFISINPDTGQQDTTVTVSQSPIILSPYSKLGRKYGPGMMDSTGNRVVTNRQSWKAFNSAIDDTRKQNK